MQLLYNIDPRDPLEKANRDQMYQYAVRNGIKEIEWWMAGNQMRSIIRKNGIKDLGLPEHRLGMPYGAAKSRESSVPTQTSSVEQLEQSQWEVQSRDVLRESKPGAPIYQNWRRAELAKECKRIGIKMARTDSKEKLVERLNGKQNAA